MTLSEFIKKQLTLWNKEDSRLRNVLNLFYKIGLLVMIALLTGLTKYASWFPFLEYIILMVLVAGIDGLVTISDIIVELALIMLGKDSTLEKKRDNNSSSNP